MGLIITESVVMVCLFLLWLLNQKRMKERTDALNNFTESAPRERSVMVTVSVMSSNYRRYVDSNVEEPLMRSAGMRSSFDG